MAANKGNDNILDDFNWQNLEQKSDYAAHWIKEQDGVKYKEVLSDIKESSRALEERANQIQAIRDKASKELADETARWDELMAEDDKIVAYLESALGTKLGGFFLSKLLQAVGKKVGSSLVAYLDVLLKKYDGLISAHDQITDELIKTYSIYSNSECR